MSDKSSWSVEARNGNHKQSLPYHQIADRSYTLSLAFSEETRCILWNSRLQKRLSRSFPKSDFFHISLANFRCARADNVSLKLRSGRTGVLILILRKECWGSDKLGVTVSRDLSFRVSIYSRTSLLFENGRGVLLITKRILCHFLLVIQERHAWEMLCFLNGPKNNLEKRFY